MELVVASHLLDEQASTRVLKDDEIADEGSESTIRILSSNLRLVFAVCILHLISSAPGIFSLVLRDGSEVSVSSSNSEVWADTLRSQT